MATIRDVAKHAGVGLGTVSRVLNNSSRVSKETRQRVLQAIEELNFTPSPIARQLSLGKTYTIGTITPFFTTPSTIERLRGVEATLANSQYNLIVFNVETAERRNKCIQDLLNKARLVDGVIMVSLQPTDEEVAAFSNANIPVILVEAHHPLLSQIVPDDIEGGRMATQHLIDLGHQHIAFVGDLVPAPFHFTSSHDRYLGYRKALKAANIPYRDNYYKQGIHGRYEANQMTHEVLTLPEPPTAIFAASDLQAIGVLEAAREQGLKVPQQLSVIGYDDIELTTYMNLTTIRQFLFESGQEGVNLLLEKLEKPEMEQITKTLSPELVERNTTAPPSH